jgi:proteasome beta subunit
MAADQERLKTGTTTIGLMCKDGIVLAADQRATIGNFIADGKAQKIHEITEDIAVTIAGSVSDAQLVIKVLKANVNLKNLSANRKSNVSEVANFLSGIIYSNIRQFSSIPSISHFLLGGRDNGGFELYDIFADGSLTKCDSFISSGSGSITAYGVLEADYKENLSVDEGVKLAVRCLHSALRRDSASGSGIQVVTITKAGIKKVIQKDLSVNLKE